MAVLALGSLGFLGGCRGWARAETGGAYNTADRPGHTGATAGADALITLKNAKWFNTGKPFPFGIHTSVDTILASDVKDVAWGTGLTYFTSPRPVAPYLIGGTNLHMGVLGDKVQFGNLSPYGEVGLATPLYGDPEVGQDGPIMTLGLGFSSFINYFGADAAHQLDGYCMLKLGIGYEKN